MKNKSLKRPWVIIIITLLLVALILVVGNQSFKATEKAAFDEFNRRQLVLAQGATGGIEMYFGHLAGDMMKALAGIPEVQRLDETPTRREIQRRFDELEAWGVNDIGVLDANGILKYNVAAHQLEGVDFSWRKYYQEAKKMTSSDTYIVEFIEFKGVEAGQKGVLVAIPIFETATDENHPAPSGRFAGVVFSTLKLDTIIQRFVAPIKSSERGHAFLIDNDYNVLWAPDGSLFGKNLLEAGQGFPAFQQIMERMRAGSSGTGEYTYYKFEDAAGRYTGDKEEKLIAYAPIRLGNELWAIGVWAPKEDAQKLIRTAYHKQLFLLGSIILIILVGSSYALTISSRISKFLEQEVETKTRELRGSSERFIAVLDSLDAAVYVADMETYEILFVNKYLRDQFGDVVGRTCWQALQSGRSGPCDFCTNKKLLTAAGEPAGIYAWEFQNTVTGRWYEIRDRAIRWVDGRIVRLEIAIDITERVRAEEKVDRGYQTQSVLNSLLQLSLADIPLHEQLERALDIILSAPFMRFDPRGGIFLVKARPEQSRRADPDALVLEVSQGLPDSLQTMCAQVPFGRCLCGRAAASGRIQFADCVDHRHENRYKGMLPHGHYNVPILSKGKVLGVIVLYLQEGHRREKREEAFLQAVVNTLAGIIERKQAEDALHESEALYRLLVENIDLGITLIDANYNIVMTNAAQGRLFNKPAGEFIGQECFREFEKREMVCAHCPGTQAMATGQPQGVETEGVRDDSSRFTVRIRAFSTFGPDGAATGFIEVVEDITERVQAEEELRQHRDHLEELIEERTAELRRAVNLMAGREVRMAELKDVIRQLRAQLHNAGLTSMADDPLAPWQETEE